MPPLLHPMEERVPARRERRDVHRFPHAIDKQSVVFANPDRDLELLARTGFSCCAFPLSHVTPIRYRARPMVLVIDNYDSFTYNLVQYLGELKVDLEVHRNDQVTLEQVRALNPERILVSPGPCSPRESGLSNAIIREF